MKHSISSAVDRINYLRSVIFVFLCFGLFFAFVKYEHKVYLSNYKNRQIQEEETATKKIITTIKELKSLAMVVSKTITTHSGDHQKIQTILASGVQVAKDYNIPTIQHITYCSTSNPKELITSSAIFPMSCHDCSSVLHQPVNELESLTTKDNYLIGTVPVFDQKTSLKGILQVSVPFADVQKFIDTEKMVTLEFPKIFDENGRRIIQNDLFNFSHKPGSKMKCNALECLLKIQAQKGVANEKVPSINSMGKNKDSDVKAIGVLINEDCRSA